MLKLLFTTQGLLGARFNIFPRILINTSCRERVNALVYSGAERLIFSFGSDKKMVVWNLRTERKQVGIFQKLGFWGKGY